MKKLLLATVLGLFSCSLFGQNVYSVAEAGKHAKRLKGMLITRTLQAPASQAALARMTVDLRAPRLLKKSTSFNIQADRVRVAQIVLKAEFVIPRLGNPSNIYGGYNYLKTLSRLSHTDKYVEPAYARMWHMINDNNTYHGAHHIVNKSTLKIIYDDMAQKAERSGKPMPMDLSEMQNNAPGIFHMLHGHPAYQRVFHNSTRQANIYYEHGMKAVITDFFENINYISSLSNGEIHPVPPAVIEGTYAEAELWCKTFHLRWE